MAIPGEPYDDALLALHEHAMAALPAGTRWFDAHTHIGHNDPDGLTATADELLAGLDRAGHHRALAFPMHEPDGYREANDEALRAAAASDGRLVALVRADPARQRHALRRRAHGHGHDGAPRTGGRSGPRRADRHRRGAARAHPRRRGAAGPRPAARPATGAAPGGAPGYGLPHRRDPDGLRPDRPRRAPRAGPPGLPAH